MIFTCSLCEGLKTMDSQASRNYNYEPLGSSDQFSIEHHQFKKKDYSGQSQ